MSLSRGAKQSGQSGFVSPEHGVGVNLDNFLTVGTEPRRCPGQAEGPRPRLGGATWFGDRVMETVLIQGSTGVSYQQLTPTFPLGSRSLTPVKLSDDCNSS